MLPSVSAKDSDFEARPKSRDSCRMGWSESSRALTNSTAVADDSHSKSILQPTRTVSIWHLQNTTQIAIGGCEIVRRNPRTMEDRAHVVPDDTAPRRRRRASAIAPVRLFHRSRTTPRPRFRRLTFQAPGDANCLPPRLDEPLSSYV